MTDEVLDKKSKIGDSYSSPNVPSLSQPKPQFNSKINTNYVESESELYVTTDDDEEYESVMNKETSPATPDTDNLEMILNDSTLEPMTLMKRVKVYFLENGDWRDIGTGYASGVKKVVEDEDNVKKEKNTKDKTDEKAIPYLVVVDEKSPQQQIIMSRLEGEIEYQRQEETLIVWRDTLGKDIALSFEEISGCDHICEFIKYIQNNLVSTISLIAIRGDLNSMDPDSSNLNINNVAELLAGPVALPIIKDDLSASELIESLKIINDNLYQNVLKTSTQKFILDKDYLNCLVSNFETNSKRNDWQKLILISSILKSIMAYNEAYIVYRILENDLFENCLAILEYDLDTPTMRANYIELYKSFKEQANLKQELWFNDDTLKDLNSSDDSLNNNSDESISEDFDKSENCKFLVGQLARLTFLKDFVFARYLEDYPIIQEVLQDDQVQLLEFITKKLKILDKLVDNVLTSEGDPAIVTQNLKMLNECILMAKTALGNRTDESAEFMQKLLDIKIFEMLKFVFGNIPEDSHDCDAVNEEVKTIATDIALAIIENDILSLTDESGSISSLSAAFMVDKRVSDIGQENQDTIEEMEKSRIKNPSEELPIDLSLISVLSNLLTKDNCQYLKPQVLHALLALLNIEGSAGVEDFLTQSISKIEYKITEIVDDESDFFSDEEDDSMIDGSTNNGTNVKLMGKSGALTMFMKQINNIDDDSYDEGEEEEDIEEAGHEDDYIDEEDLENDDFDEEDIIVDEDDEEFYDRALMGIAEEPISKNGIKKDITLESNSEEEDYDMEQNNNSLNKKEDDFNLDSFVAQFDHLEDDDSEYSEKYNGQKEAYGDSLEFPSTARDRFLEQFYSVIAPGFLESIINFKDCEYSNNNLIYLFDAFKFLIADHIKLSKFFFLTQYPQTLSNIAQIINSKNSTFRIKIKCMRLLTAIVSLNDSDYIAHIVEENLLDTTFSMFQQYGQGNAIIKSIVLEFCKLLTDMGEDKFNDTAQVNFVIIGDYVFKRYMDCILQVTKDKEYTVLKHFVEIMKQAQSEPKAQVEEIDAKPLDDVAI